MTDNTVATEPTDAELRAFWQQNGGTIYQANREVGSMPTAKLVPFLRHLVAEGAPAEAIAARGTAPAPDGVYASALVALIAAACPGLDTGNLLEDAKKAAAAFEGAQLAGYFGVDDEPTADGSARYLMVGAQHAADPDIFPLFRRAPRADDPVEAGKAAPETKTATAAAPARAGGKKAQGAQGGAP